MPAPWPADDTKNATLQTLANAIGPDLKPHCETAWRTVRGQPGFEDIHNVDDMHYVAHHWAGVNAIVQPPAITALSPNSAPANADVTVSITGTGFRPGATVSVGIAFGHVPTAVTPTELSFVIPAKNIEFAGVLPVKVVNSDGQESNSLDFTAT
jgi:IPT/TIG domain